MFKKRKNKSAGNFVFHTECPITGCSSSDAFAVYEHEDGSHSGSCFSCHGSVVDLDIAKMEPVSNKSGVKYIDPEVEQAIIDDITENLDGEDNRERKLRAADYNFYGVKVELDSSGKTIDKIYYPTYRDGELVGYRNRKRFQSWHKKVKKHPEMLNVLKDFTGGVGDTKKGIQMFGQNIFEAGGKRLIITCGEEDAVTVYQMIASQTKFDGGYATISTPSGENVEWVKPNLKYITSFSEIYIIADQDKAGKAFELELCKILPVGKVRLVRLPTGVKDPSAMWTSCKNSQQREKASKTLYKSLFSAEKYSPAGVMSLSEGWNSYINRGKDDLIPFPDSFGDLNLKTHGGYALGEIINLIAPSSVGKSSFIKESIYSALIDTKYKVGVISLEETIDEFIEGMLSIHMSTQLNELSFDLRDREHEYIKFKELTSLGLEDSGEDRIHFLDHQGSVSGEGLLEKVDFLVNGLDCKIIILDPFTLACSGADIDEDEMNSEILKRVKRHKLAWLNVHHVRKNGGGTTANSEGGELSEEDIKGSGSSFQVGMINLIFTRNKIHDNPTIRNTTKIKMSKCRRHGKATGVAGYIYYNGLNGRLELGESPERILERLGNSDDLEFY